MKWKEVTDKKSLGEVDKKARRVSNVSNKVANITAEEIESGVTLERLESLNVPVFRYGTQLTIHGKLPDFNNFRVGGYKSLVKNGNGSIGVRYIAVDGEKKTIIERCSYRVKAKMSCFSSSTGFSMQKRFETLQGAREFSCSIPNVFIGGSYIGRDMYGRFFVVVDLEAIPKANLWEFVSWFTSGQINSGSEFGIIQAKYEEKRALDKLENEKQQVIADKERAVKRAAFIAKVESRGKVVSKIIEPGYYVIIKEGRTSSINVQLYSDKLKYQTSFKKHESFIKLRAIKGPVWSAKVKGSKIYKITPESK